MDRLDIIVLSILHIFILFSLLEPKSCHKGQNRLFSTRSHMLVLSHTYFFISCSAAYIRNRIYVESFSAFSFVFSLRCVESKKPHKNNRVTCYHMFCNVFEWNLPSSRTSLNFFLLFSELFYFEGCFCQNSKWSKTKQFYRKRKSHLPGFMIECRLSTFMLKAKEKPFCGHRNQ